MAKNTMLLPVLTEKVASAPVMFVMLESQIPSVAAAFAAVILVFALVSTVGALM